MKRFFCILLVILFCISFCGCKDDSKRSFGQEITIYKKTDDGFFKKTTTQISVIDNTLNVLGLIQKTKSVDPCGSYCDIIIELTVDGKTLSYKFYNNIFIDSNGKFYETDNLNEIRERIYQIYDEINAPEIVVK